MKEWPPGNPTSLYYFIAPPSFLIFQIHKDRCVYYQTVLEGNSHSFRKFYEDIAYWEKRIQMYKIISHPRIILGPSFFFLSDRLNCFWENKSLCWCQEIIRETNYCGGMSFHQKAHCEIGLITIQKPSDQQGMDLFFSASSQWIMSRQFKEQSSRT